MLLRLFSAVLSSSCPRKTASSDAILVSPVSCVSILSKSSGSSMMIRFGWLCVCHKTEIMSRTLQYCIARGFVMKPKSTNELKPRQKGWNTHALCKFESTLIRKNATDSWPLVAGSTEENGSVLRIDNFVTLGHLGESADTESMPK